MANSTALAKLDPELAAFYADSEQVHEAEVVPRQSRPQPSAEPTAPGGSPDPLLTLQAMAEANRAKAEERKTKEPGFDTIEHDVSNVLKLGWDFVTRPLDKE